MQNYWYFSGDLNDNIGGKNLNSTSTIIYTSDRFNNSASALALHNELIQIPAGTYFNKESTISIWIQLKSKDINSSLIKFGSPMNSLNLTLNIHKNHLVFIIESNSNKAELKSQSKLNCDQWMHVAIVLKQDHASMYINGSKMTEKKIKISQNLFTSENFIGKISQDNKLIANIDDLKIYNRSLSKDEIKNDIASSCNNLKCYNDGKCEMKKSYAKCSCKSGKGGLYCDVDNESKNNKLIFFFSL